MGKFVITRSEAISSFEKGVTCCQTVLTHWADRLGYDEQELMNLGAAFGGGMGRGETCGAVTGALMAIGLMFGGENPEDMELVGEKTEEFFSRFTEKFGTTMCRELLGSDFSKPEEREEAIAAGKLFELCPQFMAEAINILDDILK
ncbi:MAG: C_GCAxxG_C_C family protein [Oscillospiraceae bacterium]|nr:C_GCAxxG_C_C family protein [Oscillospiraceae bacterium]